MMKKIFLTVAIMATCAYTAFASNSYSTDPILTDSISSTYSCSNIFFDNETNDLIFIDLDMIAPDVVQVNVVQNESVIMEEDTSELPQNMIYELELTIFDKGDYIVELLTKENEIISQRITIQ